MITNGARSAFLFVGALRHSVRFSSMFDESVEISDAQSA